MFCHFTQGMRGRIACILAAARTRSSVLQNSCSPRRFRRGFWSLTQRLKEAAMMHRVLITGASGGIGRSLRETLRGVYPVLRLSDRMPIARARDNEEAHHTEIAD